MKPRFSILTLLGITAYVAVNAAAWAMPLTAWGYAGCRLWLPILACAGIIAAGQISACAVFARGFVIWSLIYVATALIEMTLFVMTDPATGKKYALMPHDLLAGILLPTSELMQLQGGAVQNANQFTILAQLLLTNTSLIFGVIGGCLALWRYRRLERREQQEKSG